MNARRLFARCCFSIAVVLLTAAVAQAHFVWVAIDKNAAGSPSICVWFGELAEADSADLLDNVAKTEVRIRTADGTSEPVKLTKEIVDDGGAWIATVDSTAAALSAKCEYGVLEKRGKTFRLMYLAKYLDSSSADFAKLSRDESLPLDVVPTLSEGKCSLVVTWQGKPISAGEVVVIDTAGIEEKYTTDDAGKLTIPAAKGGLYSIRAKSIQPEAGEAAGKKFAETNYYTTLTLRVAGEVAKEAAPAAK